MSTDPHPPSWWGGTHPGPDRPTMLTLVQNNTLDLRTAAMLWWLVERKATLIVAAGPRLVGKTTVLTCALDLAPPRYDLVYTRGEEENFDWLPAAKPESTYIMVPELSDHTSHYLWGEDVLTVFQALEQGFSLAATMHADTPQELAAELTTGPLSTRPDLVGHIHAVANLRAVSEDPPVRRLDRLTIAARDEHGRAKYTEVCHWDQTTDSLVPADPAAVALAVTSRYGIDRQTLSADLQRRAQLLEQWAAAGHVRAPDLRQQVLDHYASGG